MKKNDIIRAWRDGDFAAQLSDAQRGALPANPAEMPAIDDDVLKTITGGCSFWGACPTSSICTPCPPNYCH